MKLIYILLSKNVPILVSKELLKKDFYGRGGSQKGSKGFWENGGRL
jgi:hypothetical protein